MKNKKNKFFKKVNIKEFEKIITPNEELKYVETSPLSSITTPPNAICFVQGSSEGLYKVNAAGGTVIILRPDSPHSGVPFAHFNSDIKSIFLGEDKKTLETKKSKEFYYLSHVITSEEDISEPIREISLKEFRRKLNESLISIVKQINNHED